jgi:hypothetical protein
MSDLEASLIAVVADRACSFILSILLRFSVLDRFD